MLLLSTLLAMLRGRLLLNGSTNGGPVPLDDGRSLADLEFAVLYLRLTAPFSLIAVVGAAILAADFDFLDVLVLFVLV